MSLNIYLTEYTKKGCNLYEHDSKLISSTFLPYEVLDILIENDLLNSEIIFEDLDSNKSYEIKYLDISKIPIFKDIYLIPLMGKITAMQELPTNALSYVENKDKYKKLLSSLSYIINLVNDKLYLYKDNVNILLHVEGV